MPYSGANTGSIHYSTADLQDPSIHTEGKASDSLLATNWNGTEITRSYNHPDWRSASRKQVYNGDIGGEFFNQKQYVRGEIPTQTFSGFRVTEGRYISRCTYSGAVLPKAPGTMDFPPFTNSSNAVVDAWGAKAIAACKPTNPVADTSVFLGELLHEGLPPLTPSNLKSWKNKTHEARKVPAETYLAYQFGWKPIARDVNSLVNATLNAHSILSQFERDSGKLVRRRFEFEPVVSEQTDIVGSNVAAYIRPSHSALYSDALPSGQVYRFRQTITRRWFSGAFTYYTPQDHSLRSEITNAVQRCRKVFGLSLTPDVVWNLSPWSWAVDWFTNTGDVLSNITDMVIYGLVLRYGYVMEHSITTDRYSFGGPTLLQNGAVRPSNVYLVTETKLRRKATPFGFGLTWNGFSATQLAIAAALGITHS